MDNFLDAEPVIHTFNTSLEEQFLTRAYVSDHVYDYLDTVKPDDFYRLEHQQIWAQIVEDLGNQNTPDPTSLLPDVTAGKVSERAYQIACDLSERIVLVDMEEIAIQILELSRRRRLAVLGKTLEYEVSAKGMDSEEAIRELRKQIDDIQKPPETGLVHVKDAIMGGLISSIIGEAEDFESTEFAGLDAVMGGGIDGDDNLIIVAARPGKGKSSYLLHRAVKRGLRQLESGDDSPIVIFSLEMSYDKVVAKMLSILCMFSVKGLSNDEVLGGEMASSRGDIFLRAYDQFMNMPIWINADRKEKDPDSEKMRVIPGAKDINQIVNILATFTARHGRCSMIALDYLQLIRDPSAKNDKDRVSKISTLCKSQIASLYGQPWVACQLNRAVETRSDKTPILSDLRDTGQIEQDADIVMFIWDPEDAPETACEWHVVVEILVAKNRHGRVGGKRYLFKKDVSRFDELEVIRHELNEPVH